MTITLSDELAALVDAHASRTGLTPDAAVEDLLRRGLTHVELRALRADVADTRAAVLDLLAGRGIPAPPRPLTEASPTPA